MVQASVADVVRPAVASDDPYAFLDQHVGHSQELFGLRGIEADQFLLQHFDALPLIENVCLIFLCPG